MIKVGSDFSGVGAFNQALIRLGIKYEEIFACDMDKHARTTFIHNYGEPKYYPTNVYDREIPSEPLDIYMTSPPCQAFSLAGKRLGKDDHRGILFFNSLEFIKVNKPRYFIFENVRGLLSDDGGKTFSEWVNLLGGKSVNGNPVMFPYEDSVPYHLYWEILNAKEHGVPQNRERVFLVGIRDDHDNTFRFPSKEPLKKKLKDILEENVDQKYFLNDRQINNLTRLKETLEKKDLPNEVAMIDSYNQSINENSICISTRVRASNLTHLSIPSESDDSEKKDKEETKNDLWVADYRNDEGLRIRKDNISPCIAARKHSETDISTMAPIVGIKEDEQKISLLDDYNQKINDTGIAGTLTCNIGSKAERNGQKLIIEKNVKVVAFGRSEEEKKRRKEHYQKTGEDSGSFKDKELIIKDQDYYDTILANPNPQKEGLIIDDTTEKIYEQDVIHNCITEAIGRQGSSSEYIDSCKKIYQATHKIRRLTPRECFRLMDFSDTFDYSVVSDTQAYKQAGNSIVVNVLYKIIKNLKL